ncbi:ketopantoate reductase family protein [Aciduliprofundum sp. MAR08-339]|uniref:2-dehydropantoate 2-reductase n=1 Tax=Aciduliprofundum sp. (strain MAR08-339) TaxID=673860 RepID=UPI00064F3A71
MKIAVFGAGSLGSVLGAILSRKNDVLLITRGEHLRAIQENGLRVEGMVNDLFHIDALDHYPGGFDLLILTVKAYQTESAAEEIKKQYDGEPVITFQNGVGVVDILKKYGFDVIPGVTTMGATRTLPGVVMYAGYGDTFIGEENGRFSERVIHFAENFTECGLRVEVVNDIMERRWVKAAINACINPLTAIMRVPNGKLADKELVEIVKCVADECSAVLSDMGIYADVFSLAMDVIEKTAKNRSSMLQDIEMGRKTEIDFITGPFIQGMCNKMLYHMVKFMEK